MASYSDSADRRYEADDHGGGAYQAEHAIAWLLALTAIVLGVIGLLRGFGIVGGSEAVTNAVQNQTTSGVSAPGSIWDGAVWLLPAISASLLALALHRTEHHRGADLGEAEGVGKFEHMLAWLFAIGTIVLGALAILVGFDVFSNGNTQADGVLWGLASIGSGALTATLHAVRHHELATDESYIVNIIERRAARPDAAMRGSTTTAPERNL